jgi:cell division transport system permease protein
VYRNAIVRLGAVTESAKWIGFVLIVIFVLTAIVTSFNTLRLVLYTSRDEIHVMRLVGAGQTYIRAPFVVAGILYGLIAGSSRCSCSTRSPGGSASATTSFFGGVNVFEYFITHFLLFFAVIIGLGHLLGAVSSFLAVSSYLRI